MATFSSTNPIKVSSGIAASYAGPVANTVLYAAPANSYAILQIRTSNAALISIGIDSSPDVPIIVSSIANQLFQNIYVGPGQSLIVISNAGNSVDVTGVEFVNNF